jgi:hypothetical protein
MKVFLPLALLLFAAPPARAAGIPRIDFERTCRDTPAVGMEKKAAFDQCMTDEKQAREQLSGTWTHAPATAREQCSALTQLGGQSSYVELITCLEMESPGQTAQPAPGGASFRNPHPQPTTAPAPN